VTEQRFDGARRCRGADRQIERIDAADVPGAP